MTTAPKKAIVIAAGRGRRLVPYTDSVPKCLVPVTDKTILEIQMTALAAAGVEEAVIIRGYRGDVLGERVDALPLPVRFVDNSEWEHNNILESLFCAAHELAGPVLLSYSDIIYTPSVARAVVASEGDISLVIDQNFRAIYDGRSDHPLDEAEVADLDSTGHVARVGKRALPAGQAWGEFIGLCKLTTAGSDLLLSTWRQLEERYHDCREQPFERAASFRTAYLTDLLQYLIGRGQRVVPVGIHGQWREIDTVQDLQRARALLRFNQENWI